MRAGKRADGTEAPWAEVLTILRLIRRWNQQQLAQSAGMKRSSIAGYERANKCPSATRRRLAMAMGFPPHLLDRTLAFVQLLRAVRESALVAGRASVAVRIDLMAGDLGRWMEEVTRDALTGVISKVRSEATPSRDAGPRQKTTPTSQQAPAPAPFVTARRYPSPVNRALMILRLIAGVRQEDLAKAMGTRHSTISDYEHDRKTPKMARVKQMVEGMGFPYGMLDRTLSFIGSAQAAREWYLAAGQDALRSQIEDVAAAEARAAEEFTRAMLGRVVAAARVLETRSLAPALWARLEGGSEDIRRALVCEGIEFQTVGLCELVCDKSVEAAGDSAELAARLANLAILIAERVPGDAGLRSRLEGFARIHWANSQRVAGTDLPAADEAFSCAAELWAASAASDPGLLNEARVLQIEASLRMDQGRPQEALSLLDRATAIDQWGQATSLLLGKAKALEAMGKFDAAIGLLRQAAPHLDRQREPWRFYIMRKNLAVNLCHLGRHGEAQLMLGEIRSLAVRFGKKLELIRVHWLEGRVAAGLGRMEEAISAFERVRTEFTAVHNAYDAALATLELAEVYAGLGRTAQVKTLAQDSAPIFEDQGVHREAQRALDLFRRAAEEDRLSIELLRSLIRYLYRARHDPRLRLSYAV